MDGRVLKGTDRFGFDVATSALLVAWVVASRVPYLGDFMLMGKDGGLYVRSLVLDASYDVPMPGNIGYVLLGKAATAIWSNPVHAYEAVNIALTCVGVVATYLVGAMVVARPIAAATAFAMSCNPMVWWHGDVIASYPVWLAVVPTIGLFGLRYVRGRRFADMIGMTVALGLGTILRPDLIAFGSPLWFGSMALGRARPRDWLIAIAILAVACSAWFFGTSWVLGGVGEYLSRVQAKHEGDAEGFSMAKKGLFEGFVRNVAKYALFLAWGSALVAVPFVRALAGRLSRTRSTWRGTVLALLWVGPSWAFSTLVFAGNAGLIFPFLPLLYLGAAQGIDAWLGRPGPRAPAIAMACFGLIGMVQFVATPLLPEINRRDVILNVTFFRYTGAGLRARYNYNLDDYGLSTSLASILPELRNPGPIPVIPPRN